MRSFAETSQFQENFEVYIQALISQCLDANFLDEVFSDQGKESFNTDPISSLLTLIGFTYTYLSTIQPDPFLCYK